MKITFKFLPLILVFILSTTLNAQPPDSIKWAGGQMRSIPFENENLAETGNVNLSELKSDIEEISFDDQTIKAADSEFADYFENSSLKLAKIVTHFQSKDLSIHTQKIELTAEDDTKMTLEVVLKETGEPESDSTDPEPIELSILEKQAMAQTYFDNNHKSDVFRWRSSNKSNLILENKTVHVYIDEFGKTYGGGFPTTAREDYSYTLHIFYVDDGNREATEQFAVEVEGIYQPVFDIYGAAAIGELRKDDPTGSQSSGGASVTVKEITYEKMGPYTGSFTVEIKKQTKDGQEIKTENVLNKKTIKVATLHQISVSVGLLGTYLSDPSNFELAELPSGENTVIADDPETRGLFTVMATFYPVPRNLLYAPNSFKERIGFNVGTSLDNDFDQNFFGGISIDLARGLSIAGGLHYGRVTRLAGVDDDFNFGEDVYEGEIKTKEEWHPGFYIGAVIDARVFGTLFNRQVNF